MGIPVIMTIDEAYSAVKFYNQNLWLALKTMEEEWDDLDSYERSAYKMVYRELEQTVD